MRYAIVYLLAFFTLIQFSGCKVNKESARVKIIDFSVAQEIPVIEPSGLALTSDESGFWVVGDENGIVCLLDSRGRKVKSFKIDGNDLEGVTVINDSTLAVVLERKREVVVLDTSGIEQRRIRLDLKGEENSGLEGITYDPSEKKFYVLNEKKPMLLLILDENLKEVRRIKLNFSKDVSGIYFDEKEKVLWIVSDESRMVVKTDLDGVPVERFKIKVSKAEGIALNKDGTKLYLVSNHTNSIYVFNIK